MSSVHKTYSAKQRIHEPESAVLWEQLSCWPLSKQFNRLLKTICDYPMPGDPGLGLRDTAGINSLAK